MTSTEASIDPATLDAYTGKRVSLVFTREVKGEGDAPATTEQVEQEGRVEVGAAIGLMFKEKGKSNVQFIETPQIVSVTELAVREPKVTVKTLQPVAAGRVRQHLADRHGYPLDQVNGLTEAAATELHDGIDHSTLAHKHEVPKAEADAATGDEPIIDVSDIEGAEPEDESDDYADSDN